MPVLCVRKDWLDRELQFLDPVIPRRGSIARSAAATPETAVDGTGDLYRHNSERFSLVTFAGRQVLLDKELSEARDVDEVLTTVPAEFAAPRKIARLELDGFSVSEEALRELVDMEILVAVRDGAPAEAGPAGPQQAR